MSLSYASLKSRFVAMIYESLLIGAVTIVALLVSAIFVYLLKDYTKLAQLTVTIVLILSWRWYFLSSWKSKEQTLAMKTWHITLKNQYGNPANSKQLNLRFIWALIFIVMIPVTIYMMTRNQGYPPKICIALALIWWILPWGWALLNRQRQFLYDTLAGTQLFHQP